MFLPRKGKFSVEPSKPFFKRISIVGLGLIGGSWALALKKLGYPARRIGCDLPDVLSRATASGAVHEGAANAAEAVRDADLVILATPVGEILELLPQMKSAAPRRPLITDVGSTKRRIIDCAKELDAAGLMFLGGHPLAGKERCGFEHADPSLFENASYALVPPTAQTMEDVRAKAFIELVKTVGALPYVTDAESHDLAVAFLSHMPQLLSSGLASLAAEKSGAGTLPMEMAGSGFRDMTRLADSPYSLWRDICLTNTDNIQAALETMIRKLDSIRINLRSGELEKEFDQARKLRDKLRE